MSWLEQTNAVDLGTPSANPLQAEAESLRLSTIANRIEKGMDGIPTPILTFGGALCGMLSCAPGEIGLFGKATAIGLTAGITTDAILKISQHKPLKQTLIRDGGTLAAIGTGFMIGTLPRMSALANEAPEIRPEAQPLSDLAATKKGELLSITTGRNFRPVEMEDESSLAILREIKEGKLIDKSYRFRGRVSNLQTVFLFKRPVAPPG